MKRFALAGGLALACIFGLFAHAANITLTPIVGPTETGENSAGAQQVTDMARLKVGMGTLSASGGPTAFTGTLNFAAGIITLPSATVAASGSNSTTMTLTNSKVQAGDEVQCTIDSTNSAPAGATPFCASVKVSAGQIIFVISDASATAMTAANLFVHYIINTQGNPN